MLTENDVIQAVAEFLPSLGHAVESTCTTNQRGVDIVARHAATVRRLRVEAKGGTSSKEHTDRFGQGFNGGQVLSHVSRALYKAAAMLRAYPADEVALALPDDEQHRRRIEAILPALGRLGISVFFVGLDGSVRVGETGLFAAESTVVK